MGVAKRSKMHLFSDNGLPIAGIAVTQKDNTIV